MNKKIVCLGGGIGTVNLIKGLKKYFNDITVVVSMADEGGSSGRLRRLYKIPPPGDLVSCMAALCGENNDLLSKVLTYRFPGDRYGKDDKLDGHKTGNLLMAAMIQVCGSLEKAISLFQKTFNIPGVFLPATSKNVSISALTIEGKKIYGEEAIDLGKYDGKRTLEKVFLHPKNIDAAQGVCESIEKADAVIAGPGDLYTTILPVLIIPSVSKALRKTKANKIFIMNVANKPFETKNYKFSDYINAIKKHLNYFPFDKALVNTNYSVKIPSKYKYSYVRLDNVTAGAVQIIKEDLVNEDFPLYHCSSKLAKVLLKNI